MVHTNIQKLLSNSSEQSEVSIYSGSAEIILLQPIYAFHMGHLEATVVHNGRWGINGTR